MNNAFYTLLRAGLWGTPADPTLFNADTDWAGLYRMAKKQTVTGILLDGIQTLPPKYRPPRMLYLQWCNDLIVIEEKNHLLNKELAEALTILQKEGVEPVLVKGQGIAQCYRQPLHRTPGDIDLYIGAEHFENANHALLKDGRIVEEEDFKHVAIERHGVCIENHRILISLSSPLINRRLQQETKRWHSNHNLCRKVQIESYEVLTPPDAYNVSYLLIHILKHFLSEGIGIRQLCDWACLLHNLTDEKTRTLAVQLLKELKLEKTARIFGYLSNEYIGLPSQYLLIPFQPQDVTTAQWVWSDIWTGGNFGKHGMRRRPVRNYWLRKWETFERVLKRCHELGSISPSEARWYPIALTVQSFTTQWKKRTKKSTDKKLG